MLTHPTWHLTRAAYQLIGSNENCCHADYWWPSQWSHIIKTDIEWPRVFDGFTNRSHIIKGLTLFSIYYCVNIHHSRTISFCSSESWHVLKKAKLTVKVTSRLTKAKPRQALISRVRGIYQLYYCWNIIPYLLFLSRHTSGDKTNYQLAHLSYIFLVRLSTVS